MSFHTVEKIGGTSMSDYVAVRDNIILKPVHNDSIYNRIFVVSAYGGLTDLLLEHKKTGRPGVYGLFASGQEDDSWKEALQELKQKIFAINETLYQKKENLEKANAFIGERLDDAERCLCDLQRLCQHGHFELEMHLETVREMLASIGEAPSAWNTSQLLQRDGIEAKFVDLTAWQTDKHMPLDERIKRAFEEIDLSKQ
jgi:aspartate kinase